MRLFNPDIVPPETGEVVGKVATLLRVETALVNLMPVGPDGSVGVAVFEGERAVRSDKTKRGKGGEFLRVIVREPVNPYGPPLAPSIEVTANVEVVVEASEAGPTGWDPDVLLRAAQSAVYRALVGQHLDLKHSHHRGGLWAASPPSPPAFDADLGVHYSIARYRAHLAPL